MCIEDENNPKFVIETKAITENLDNHTPQSISYAIGVKVNFIVLTNGKEFRIYNVNDPIFLTNTIEELDLKFDKVKEILSRNIIRDKSPSRIIQSIDLNLTLDNPNNETNSYELKRKQLIISDFKGYLNTIRDNFSIWQKPFGFQNNIQSEIGRFPPERLLKFTIYSTSQKLLISHEDEVFILSDIESKLKKQIIVLIGDSGIGKTTLLKYLVWMKSNECINLHNFEIPIFIQLRQFGLNTSLKDLITNFLINNGLNIPIANLNEFLKKYQFIFFLDAYDEIPEIYVDDFNVEFESLFSNHSYRIFITSRKLRIPNFHNQQFYWSIL